MRTKNVAKKGLQAKKGICIGNGLSRESFDLNLLKGKATIAGCNFLYLDFDPDYLITLDVLMNRIIKHMVEKKLKRSWQWVSRELTKAGNRVLTVEGFPLANLDEVNGGFNNQSGILAAAFLAEILQVTELYLIGIDFFLPVPGRRNDIYAGNGSYSDGIAHCWNTMTERNQDCLFYRVGEIADQDRDFYQNKLKGFTYIEDFKDLPIL